MPEAERTMQDRFFTSLLRERGQLRAALAAVEAALATERGLSEQRLALLNAYDERDRLAADCHCGISPHEHQQGEE